MNDFNLIKELGLEVIAEVTGTNGKEPCYRYTVRASDLEALLEKALPVYGHDPKLGSGRNVIQWFYDEMIDASRGATHSALLINIKEIQKDTADSLLRELIYRGDIAIPHGLFERAQKVLNASATKKP